jgi:hypothetical protein
VGWRLVKLECLSCTFPFHAAFCSRTSSSGDFVRSDKFLRREFRKYLLFKWSMWEYASHQDNVSQPFLSCSSSSHREAYMCSCKYDHRSRLLVWSCCVCLCTDCATRPIAPSLLVPVITRLRRAVQLQLLQEVMEVSKTFADMRGTLHPSCAVVKLSSAD